MMKKSLRSKLILNFVMSVVLVMLTLIAATNFVFRPILIHDTRDSMMSYAALISEAYDNGSATINKLIAMLDSSHDYETVIYRDDISVIASYEQMYPTSGRIAMIKEWMKEYEEHKKSDGTFFKEIEKNSDNLSRTVYIKELSDGTYLCMSKVVRGVDQIVYIATIGVTVGAIFLIIIGTAIWSVLTKSFTSQLKKMSIVTQKMSQLNFDEKIDYHSEDEVGVLAESIDEMSDELKVSIEKLKKDVERRKRLIRDMSHELKTPVTTVSGYTENIQLLVPDNPRVQRYCDIMLEECDVINNLVQEMLYMSKLEDETFGCKKESFEAGKLKGKILNRIENEFSAESIIWDLENIDIFADINLIERAVYNFITNAIKHRAENTDVEVRGYRDGDRYVFAVTNYGDEIPQEEQELIWDVFYKCDKSRNRGDSGHGIGLAIVKRIAVLHGGEVGLTVGDGKNTFFIKI